MNLGMIVYVLGWILICEGALLLLPAIVSVIYRETAVWALLGTAALCAVFGLLMVRTKPKKKVFYLRDGFLVTALSWLLISIMGALPFLFSGSITDPIEAVFETVSGFTTTGASILSDVEALPKGILFWRSFTHWIGGMGVLVFLLTLLPLTGGSHINLMKAESPGPQVERLVPSVQSTAKILYGIYFVLTVVEIIILLLGDMPWFDALTLTFGSAGTGGFGIKNDSLGSYTAFQQNVVTISMILFGINFNFYFLLLMRRARKAFAMEEVRAYLGIILTSILLISLNIRNLYGTFGESLRHAAFQVGSIITTTGYSTTDFDLWPSVSKTVLVVLMFVGACAGSTGGGIKVSRIMVLIRTIRQEMRHVLHPQSVNVTTMDGKTVPRETLRSINAFLVSYFVIFALSIFLISFDNFDMTTNFTAIAATLNNIGPGLAAVGPTQNFSIYSPLSQLVLIFDMLAGRLELFPMMLLFHKETWRGF